MELNKFIESLKIPSTCKVTSDENKCIVTIPNSDEYAKVYTLLSKNESLKLDEETFKMDEHSSTIVYIHKDYEVLLTANFDDDKYLIEISRKETR